ncbi:MAG: flagellar M-ring protein FliF, partial [Desulfobacterales bacterium]|nr:flagellar M-ring protein FliF [Desulfobacterales bacterium]
MSLEDIPSQLKVLSANLSAGKKIGLFLLVAATMSGFILLMTWASRPEYQILFSDLSMEDSAAIFEKLKERKIPYQIAANGKTILVPQEQVYELRLELASQGLTRGSSVGFELFDNTRLGMTEFMQNVNYQRALQGELSRTINQFDEVESSRVHLVMANKSIFTEKAEPATASVILMLKSGRKLNYNQVQGIVNLVSSSISGLSSENVTIVDNDGKLLTRGDKNAEGSNLSTDQLAFQERLEKKLEDRVKTMLENALGSGKAIVRLSASMNFDQREQTEERYLADNRVVRSEKVHDERRNSSKSVPSGVPGAVPNMTSRGGAQASKGTGTSLQTADRVVNYEIGKVISRVVMPTGKVERISVAVMIDGHYRRVENKEGVTEFIYIPRTDEEMTKFENIIKSAVNYNTERGDKIEVVNIPFKTAVPVGDETPPEPGWLDKVKAYAPFYKYGIMVFFMIFAFLFIVRPIVKWLTAGGVQGVEML